MATWGYYIPTWVIYNPESGKLYFRRSLFTVNYDHEVIGTLDE